MAIANATSSIENPNNYIYTADNNFERHVVESETVEFDKELFLGGGGTVQYKMLLFCVGSVIVSGGERQQEP